MTLKMQRALKKKILWIGNINDLKNEFNSMSVISSVNHEIDTTKRYL